MKTLEGYSIGVCVKENEKYARHQLETPEKLSRADVVFNTYPTGTGKTRALLNAIKETAAERALIIAPTNALIYQYQENVKEFLQKHDMPHKLYVATSESLDEISILSHSLALKNTFADSKKAIVITNPDIVFYVIMQKFGRGPATQRSLIVELFRFPELIAFDEFHYYDPSRIFFAFVLIATAKQFNRKQKYLFMTATPNEYLVEAFQKSGLVVEVVEFTGKEEEKTTPVASPIDVEILDGNLDGRKEELLDVIVKHLEEQRDILVISDALSRIIKFGEELRKRGIDFGMVTGPMKSEDRKEALQKNLILATPTIDIGYDFSRPYKERQGIDTVIFETNESDTLIQRLGRAGRVFGKRVTKWPSTAYLLIPSNWYKKVVGTLERSSTRLEFNREVKEVLPSPVESIKREYLGPYRLILGFYEDAFSLLFPKEYKDLLNEYFNVLESMFGLKLRSQNLWRNELDFYYLCKALLHNKSKGGSEEIQRILNRNQQLKMLIEEQYSDFENLKKSCKAYEAFIDHFILSFRSSPSKEIYIWDPKKLSGSSEFTYDKLRILTQYKVKKLTSIPKCYQSQGIKDGFELIGVLEKATGLFLEVRTGLDNKFFIPRELQTQCFGSEGRVEMTGTPVYRVSPEEEPECWLRGFRILEAQINGQREKILIGDDALKAASYLSKEPWKCNLFPG